MEISNQEFIILKTGPLVVEGNYAFKDYTMENVETKEKIKARCTSRFTGCSSFEIIKIN